MTTAAPPSARRLGVVLVALVTASCPPFMVGALAIEINDALGMSAAAVGIAVGACYLSAACMCLVVGPWVDRIGARAALRVACTMSTVTMVAMAAAPSSEFVIGALVVQGLPIALSQPTANLVLSGVPAGRARGLYFGIIQSSIPASILLSGLMLGVVVGEWGWRPPFLLVAALALLGILAGRGEDPHALLPEPDRLKSVGKRPRNDAAVAEPRWPCLVLLGTGGLLGSATATVLPAFAASAGREGGLDASAVGLGIACASIGCIVLRVAASALGGWLRSEQALALLAAVLLGGVAGYAGLSLGDGQTFLVSLVVAYGLGWGWPGVFNLTVIAARPDAVGTMTGRTQAAMFAGGMAGPAAFGIVAEQAGYQQAWAGTAVFAAVAAGCFLGATLLWPRARGRIALDTVEVTR